MANIIKVNPFYIATEGIISAVPLCITKIILKPAATGDAATFTTWVESDSTITTYGDLRGKTLTVTAATGTFVCNTFFEQDSINVDQIMKVTKTSSGKNLGYWQIKSNDDDNTITVDLPLATYGQSTILADDVAGVYSWKVWDNYNFLTIKGSGMTSTAADLSLVQVDFHGGFWVPNLAMNTLSSNAVLWIYLK